MADLIKVKILNQVATSAIKGGRVMFPGVPVLEAGREVDLRPDQVAELGPKVARLEENALPGHRAYKDYAKRMTENPTAPRQDANVLKVGPVSEKTLEPPSKNKLEKASKEVDEKDAQTNREVRRPPRLRDLARNTESEQAKVITEEAEKADEEDEKGLTSSGTPKEPGNNKRVSKKKEGDK